MADHLAVNMAESQSPLNLACTNEQTMEQEQEEEEDVDVAVQRRRRKRKQSGRFLIIELSDDDEDDREKNKEREHFAGGDTELCDDHAQPESNNNSAAASVATVAVSWYSLPPRNVYLAAKVHAWRANNTEAKMQEMSARPLSPVAEHDLSSTQRRFAVFESLAQKELQFHGLHSKWRVRFDNGKIRAGECRFNDKILSFSRYLVERGSYQDMVEVLRHEIAHAIVGPKHHHDSTWRAVALRIGCSGDRCHSIELAEPVWILACPRGCWSRKCFKRSYLRRGCWCNVCGATCSYERVRPSSSALTTSIAPTDKDFE